MLTRFVLSATGCAMDPAAAANFEVAMGLFAKLSCWLPPKLDCCAIEGPAALMAWREGNRELQAETS